MADPASYHYAANTLQALRVESETTPDMTRLLATVSHLSRALRSAVGEWQDGKVP